MPIRRIELRNFRNFERFSFDPGNGVNSLIGPNGSGKTNLVEGIYLLALAKSWRTNGLSPLIKQGAPAAFVSADIEGAQAIRRIDIAIQRDVRRVMLDGKPIKRLSELYSVVNVLLFAPDDVTLFKGAPARRRSFVDISISKRDPKYLKALIRYDRLLEERNAALRDENPVRELLDALTEQIIAESAPIAAARRKFFEDTNKILEVISAPLYGPENRLQIAYRPFVKTEDFEAEAKKAYDESYESDLSHRTTSIGIHREDFSAYLNGADIASYGSQGQNRLAAVALKLSPAFLPHEPKETPIVVLDDVMGELDEERGKALLKTIEGVGQTFITSTNIEIPQATTLRLGE